MRAARFDEEKILFEERSAIGKRGVGFYFSIW
jgi:hypothetical protein